MAAGLTDNERKLLIDIQTTTAQLARKVHEASEKGFQINFNINGQLGTVDKFEVTRAVPVDFTAGTN